PCVSEIHEPALVQAFIAELSVEALDERVLRRLAALDEVQRHLILIGRLIPNAAGGLRSVIYLGCCRCASSFSLPSPHPPHARPRSLPSLALSRRKKMYSRR